MWTPAPRLRAGPWIECHRKLQRHHLCFSGAGRTRGTGSCERDCVCGLLWLRGDCGNYHGWVVGVDINNPSNVQAWATTATGGGIWGHGGVASDGTNMFVVTGNTFNTGGNWMGGEAIIRLQAGPTGPANLPITGRQPTGSLSTTRIPILAVSARRWSMCPEPRLRSLCLRSAKIRTLTWLIAIISAVSLRLWPRLMSLALTEEHQLSRTTPVREHISGFITMSGTIRAYKITPTNPPTITFAWSMSQTGRGSPWVTTTDGTNNTIVWVAGARGDQRLHGYDGDTGAVIYAGGGANELMTGTRQWNTGIAARGRIYFGADNKIYAFSLPAGTPTPTPTAIQRPRQLQPPRQLLLRPLPHIYTHGHRDCHPNIDGNNESDSDCHGHRFRQSDADAQTNAYCRDRVRRRGRARLRRQGPA